MNRKKIKEISVILASMFRRLDEEPGLNLAGSIESNLVELVTPLTEQIASLEGSLAKANKGLARFTTRIEKLRTEKKHLTIAFDQQESSNEVVRDEARKKRLSAGPIDPPLWALKEARRIVSFTGGPRTSSPRFALDEILAVARSLTAATSGGPDDDRRTES